MKEAIVLLSGGIDSITVMAIAIGQGYKVSCLTFDYGQKNNFEVNKTKQIVGKFNVKNHLILKLQLDKLGGSALTSDIKVPEHKSNNAKSEDEIPITYVPARNTIFLSYALAWAEVLNITDIFFGANTVDYSGYPDCRREYVDMFQKVANLGTKQGISEANIRIHTPLISMSKADIIKKGTSLDLDYSITSSCYDPYEDGLACGVCDSCVIRKEGFRQVGLTDPEKYKD